MTREGVYKLIDEERSYQDSVRKDKNKETRNDNEKSVSDFILYMDFVLQRAKEAIYELDESMALEYVRKITALGVATMETHETKPRI